MSNDIIKSGEKVNLPSTHTTQNIAVAVGNNIIVPPCGDGLYSLDDFNEKTGYPDQTGYFHTKININGQDVVMHTHATQIIESFSDKPKQGMKVLPVQAFTRNQLLELFRHDPPALLHKELLTLPHDKAAQ